MQEISSITELYTTLFVIAITIIGIAIAGVIALTQVLQPLLTFKSTQKIIRTFSFKLSSALLLATSLLTLLPMFLLSLASHNLIGFVDFNSTDIFTSQWYIAAVIALLLLALVSVIILIYEETQYLVPTNALRFLKSNSKDSEIATYFDSKYATAPNPIDTIVTLFDWSDDELIAISQEDEETDDAAQEKYEKELEEYERKRKIADKLENPLLPLESYITQSIRKNDLQTTIKSLQTFEEIIQNLAKKDFANFHQLVKYYRVVLENATELSQSLGLQSFVLELVDSSARLSDILIENKKFDAINNLLEYWQNEADKSIAKHPTEFKLIMSTVRECGESIIRNEKIKWDECKGLADNICRTLGWLGERMLDARPPEKKAIMHMDYETEFEALMNAVLGIGWGFHTDRPDVYPLIFFDCLYVIAKKLAPYCVDKSGSDNDNNLFSLMHDLDSFAMAALRKKNIDGASLALLNLQQHFEIAKEHNLEQQEQYILESIFSIGAFAASQGVTEVADFLINRGRDMTSAVISLLQKYVGHHSLDNEAHEIIIKSDIFTDHKATKGYLIAVGRALSTDFGLNLVRRANSGD